MSRSLISDLLGGRETQHHKKRWSDGRCEKDKHTEENQSGHRFWSVDRIMHYLIHLPSHSLIAEKTGQYGLRGFPPKHFWEVISVSVLRIQSGSARCSQILIFEHLRVQIVHGACQPADAAKETCFMRECFRGPFRWLAWAGKCPLVQTQSFTPLHKSSFLSTPLNSYAAHILYACVYVCDCGQ